MGNKHKRTKTTKAATGPTLRWLVCEDGDVHIVGPCPRCFQSSGGMLIGTSETATGGITRAECADCGETIDYYVDPENQQIWKAQVIREPVNATCAS